MPPRVKYGRDEVIRAAVRVAREGGMEAVNARAVAKALGCSTQPLFREFQSMDEIRAEVLREAWKLYSGYIARSASLSAATPYKGTGLAYVRMAREEPALFKALFMRSRKPEEDEGKDDTLEYVLGIIMRQTGYTREQAERFHLHMWVYAHGVAAMTATGFVSFTDEDLEKLFSEEYLAMRMYYEKNGAP